MTTAAVPATLEGARARLADLLVGWLETGVRPADMFADDVFADLTVPQWRIQSSGTDPTFRLREDSHPYQGSVRIEALDQTARGFLLQFEERWEAGGQQWYCRELIHAIVVDDRIGELVISCTGDWDEALQSRHAQQVTLLRS